MEIENIISFLKNYDGEEITLMEVCGTHTASICENAIPSIISDKIKLISGPGCPVCVTPSAYIDKLIDLAQNPKNCIVTFGDMIRVPGSKLALKDITANGCRVKMVYTPFEIIELAKNEPDTNFIFAAVGFETTTPIYALLIEKLICEKINNVKLLTALKTMPNAIDTLCKADSKIDGFIAPGNVSVIIGEKAYSKMAEKYNLPFVISGFDGKELLATVYALVKLKNQGKVLNLYSYAVDYNANEKAMQIVNKYFTPCDSAWRGMGIIKNSGMKIRDEYKAFDAGSDGLTADISQNQACMCSQIIIGKAKPCDCPLYKKICTPDTPQGACMVSNEGTCFNYYTNNRG